MYSMTVFFIYVIVAFRWGDWRNWKQYQSSILYVITLDLLYNFLYYNHSLWEYEHTFIFANHTIASIIAMFVLYPAILLVYLGRYPSGTWKQILWISLWVIGMILFEWGALRLKEFSHHNGWKLIHSVWFNILLFSMVRLHYKKPLLAFGLSFIITILILLLFKVSITEMK